MILTVIPAHAGDRTRAVNRPFVFAAYATPADGPWRIEIVSTGGITGAGTGDLRIDSTGKITVGQFVPNGRTCEFFLTPGELSQLTALVKALQPDLWFASYVPADSRSRCCDLIFSKVIIERSETIGSSTKVETGRYDTQLVEPHVRPNTPRDLLALWNVLVEGPDDNSFKSRYLKECWKQP